MKNKIYILLLAFLSIIGYAQCVPSVTNPDSDGDGIADICDLDDDNDGILDTTEDCFGYRAQNTNNTTWLGNTTSTLNVVSTGFSAQTTAVQEYNDGQNVYWVNQNDAQPRITRQSTASHSLTYTFSPGVPASEIAFMNEDADPAITGGSANLEYTFLVNDAPSNDFSTADIGNSSLRMIYDSSTGKIKLNGNVNDQFFFLKGKSSTIVNKITLISTGGGRNDLIAYSLFAYKTCDTDNDGIPNHLDLDSDADGCPDAIEGDADVHSTQLVDAIGTVTAGSTSATVQQNLCANSSCINTSGVPQFTTIPTGYNNTNGQGEGDSQNSLVNQCICFKDPVNNGLGKDTRFGITLLKRAGSDNADNWPMVRKSGHMALESNKQGFVITRIAKTDLGNISNPQEGMMVYDTTDKCLKIYSDVSWNCFTTPTCP
jgi:hypothetical protein